MKKQLLILIIILTIVKANGQDTIHSPGYSSPITINFEDRNSANYIYIDTTQSNNIWQIGIPSKKVFNNAYSVPYALVTDTLKSYPNGNISSFEFVIWTDDQSFITFWHRINSDSLADGGIVEVSKDGGETWTNIIDMAEFKLTGFYTSHHTISSNFNHPGFTGRSGWVESIIEGFALDFVRFRFTFTSDNINTNKDGWIIDNFNFHTFGTGINEQGPNSALHVFPNPTSELVSVNATNQLKIKYLTVRDILGRVILNTEDTTINLSEFNSGIYLIEITTDNGKFIKRLEKQ